MHERFHTGTGKKEREWGSRKGEEVRKSEEEEREDTEIRSGGEEKEARDKVKNMWEGLERGGE